MKTYENEQIFVENFAKDAKSELKSGQNFEATVNNAVIVVSGMNNDNSSKVTVYSGSVDGVEFTGSITALKKKLNVTFKKEYNRSSEAAKSAKTVITIKTDEELSETAKVADERIKQAVATLNKYANRYLIMFNQLVNDGHECEDENGNPTWKTVYDLILAQLKQERDTAKAEAAKREAERLAKEEAKRIAEIAITNKRNRLMAELAEASSKQNFDHVMELTKELAKLK